MSTVKIAALLLCVGGLAWADSGQRPSTQVQEWKVRCSEAQALFHAGQWRRAETTYLQAVQMARTTPDGGRATLAALDQLALYYMSSRQFGKAVQTLSELLPLQRSVAAKGDRALVNTMNLLGVSYRELHRYNEALAAHQQALKILEADVPERSAELGLTLSALGSVADAQCQFVNAQGYFTRALKYLDHAQGDSAEFSRVRTWTALGSEYTLLGHFDKANPLFTRALEVVNSPKYAQTALLLQTLDRAAVSQVAQRKFTDAERLWKRALTVTSQESRYCRLAVLLHLAEVQCLLREEASASELLQQAEQLHDQIWSKHGNLYAMIVAERGLVALASGDKGEATTLLERALEISKGADDRDAVDYAELLSYRAIAAESVHDLMMAKELLSEAIQIQRKVLGDCSVTANSLLAYARVLKKLKLKDEAKQYERTGKAILERLPAGGSSAYTVDVKALRQGW